MKRLAAVGRRERGEVPLPEAPLDCALAALRGYAAQLPEPVRRLPVSTPRRVLRRVRRLLD